MTKNLLNALRIIALSLIIGLTASIPRTAMACPDGQYESCVFTACWCMPTGDTVVHAVDPLPDILSLAGGVVHGNIHEISQSVGALVIKSSCPGCSVTAHTVMNANDRAFAEAVVGRGWLVFFSTGSPSIVLADAATSIATEYKLTHPKPNPMSVAPSPERGVKHYTTQNALCSVLSTDGTVAAGWVDAPSFSDPNGRVSVFPGVDLVDGDFLDIQAANSPKDCPAPPAGQTRPSHFKMKYSYSSVSPGTQTTAMKYVLVGSITKP
ncbi:hypothetical protein [Burkholderia sp. BE17]|uniref:hypothetical protein n=1 Tax=Burkholderia sp. BE17 TaxID=2656644 RepID=UPI00128BF887|nr:hypothetical protein [Burkholderia sp. BE17]MPV69494.1 hypothetical protein [Burkholderia sp. BE17]